MRGGGWRGARSRKKASGVAVGICRGRRYGEGVESEIAVTAEYTCPGHTQAELDLVVARAVGERGRSLARYKETHPQDPGTCHPVWGEEFADADWEGVGQRWLNSDRRGDHRVVVAICNEHVMKIEVGVSDFEQTIEEVRIWRGADETTRQYLAPVLASGKVDDVPWLVMPYCAVEEGEEEVEELSRRVLGLDDVEVGNVGWLDGRLVVLDYGRPLMATAEVIIRDPGKGRELG